MKLNKHTDFVDAGCSYCKETIKMRQISARSDLFLPGDPQTLYVMLFVVDLKVS